MKIKVVNFSETSVNFYTSERRHVPQNLSFDHHHPKNLMSQLCTGYADLEAGKSGKRFPRELKHARRILL
jgi:hypothetical protein